jgi:hypothetical protein
MGFFNLVLRLTPQIADNPSSGDCRKVMSLGFRGLRSADNCGYVLHRLLRPFRPWKERRISVNFQPRFPSPVSESGERASGKDSTPVNLPKNIFPFLYFPLVRGAVFQYNGGSFRKNPLGPTLFACIEYARTICKN